MAFLSTLFARRDRPKVGYGECGEPADSYRPGKYAFDIGVLPAYPGRGSGTALYDRLLRRAGQTALTADHAGLPHA